MGSTRSQSVLRLDYPVLDNLFQIQSRQDCAPVFKRLVSRAIHFMARKQDLNLADWTKEDFFSLYGAEKFIQQLHQEIGEHLAAFYPDANFPVYQKISANIQLWVSQGKFNLSRADFNQRMKRLLLGSQLPAKELDLILSQIYSEVKNRLRLLDILDGWLWRVEELRRQIKRFNPRERLRIKLTDAAEIKQWLDQLDRQRQALKKNFYPLEASQQQALKDLAVHYFINLDLLSKRQLIIFLANLEVAGAWEVAAQASRA